MCVCVPKEKEEREKKKRARDWQKIRKGQRYWEWDKEGEEREFPEARAHYRPVGLAITCETTTDFTYTIDQSYLFHHITMCTLCMYTRKFNIYRCVCVRKICNSGSVPHLTFIFYALDSFIFYYRYKYIKIEIILYVQSAGKQLDVIRRNPRACDSLYAGFGLLKMIIIFFFLLCLPALLFYHFSSSYFSDFSEISEAFAAMMRLW